MQVLNSIPRPRDQTPLLRAVPHRNAGTAISTSGSATRIQSRTPRSLQLSRYTRKQAPYTIVIINSSSTITPNLSSLPDLSDAGTRTRVEESYGQSTRLLSISANSGARYGAMAFESVETGFFHAGREINKVRFWLNMRGMHQVGLGYPSLVS